MRKGTTVWVKPPRGAMWLGKYVGQVTTHNGVWYEVLPLGATDPKRCRPAMVTAA